MKRVKLLFTVLSLFAVSFAFAQNITVTGTVTDASTGEPVPFASIQLKGTTQGANTDDSGHFKMTIKSKDILIFSSIGYLNQEITISNQSNFNVKLQPDAIALEDVVILGYGSARKVGTTVGSITKVSSKILESRPQASAFETLQGNVAGLQVYTSSGDPGTVQSIRLHGIGTIGNGSNTPLYILDGIAVESRTILAMNPNDIESMSVLKDASATSIYGSRAANGVIYVTTKRGSTGSAVIKLRGQYGASSLADRSFHDRMMSTEQLWNFWEETGLKTPSQMTTLKDALKKNNLLEADGSYHNFKWIDYMQKPNKPSWQADIAISGGGKSTTYYISGAAYSEDGTAPGTYFKRYNIRTNIDSRVNSWFKVGTNVQLSLDKRQTNSQYGGNSTGGGLSFLKLPYYSPYAQDGSEPDIMPGTSSANPYYYINTHPDEYKRYGVNISGYVELEPIKKLKIRSVAGLDKGIILDSWQTMPSYLDRNNGTRGESTADQHAATITNTVEYAFTIKQKHNITVLAGQEGVQNSYKYYYAQSKGQTDDRLNHLNNGKQSTYTMQSEDNESQFLSFFGRADYSFDNRLFLDASVRNDASSRFSANNRRATFWAVGGMWNLKNESFMQSYNWLNLLNVKVSYGTQGNASIDDYLAYATIGETTKYGQNSGWVLSDPGNPNLTWEKQKKLTAGITAKFFDMLNISVEYYNRITTDMLMSVPVPYTTGYGSILNNVGSLSNNGVDITLGLDILQGKDYYLGFNFNINYNSEKITKLFDGRNRWEVANTGVAYVVGKPVLIYYPIYAGVNSETGKQQWYLPGEDKDVTTKDPNRVTDKFNAAELTQNTGVRRYAPVAGGFNINGSWKGIGLSADFAFVIGKNLISNDRFFSENPANFSDMNTSSNVLDYWKNPGDIAAYPNWKDSPVMQFDTHLLENASFMRLKNLTLSYTLPKQYLGNNNILQGIKVFFTGRNLWTVKSKDFKGTDPEVDSNLTYGKVINSRQLQGGIELTF
ncbi:MAG: SusC/RagA family TonB-linked outer membrane protein [Bacteroidales bacterium]